jgi:uncharacterized protein YwqG
MDLREGLRSTLNKSSLAPIAPQLLALTKESFRIRSIPTADELIPVGGSKLGGWPDLQNDLAWPKWKDVPLSFVAQINLTEVPENSLLARTGLLSFFYDTGQTAWGFDPNHKEGFRVLYFPEISGLNRIVGPEKSSPSGLLQKLQNLTAKKPHQVSAFPSCQLSFSSFLSLPESCPEDISDLLLDLDDDEIYFKFLDNYRGEGPEHQLLGWPHPIQGEMESECQSTLDKTYPRDSGGDRDSYRQALKAQSSDWILLLQIDSDDKAGMMWGDLGMLYFWIRRQDLAALNFEKAWTILQCY